MTHSVRSLDSNFLILLISTFIGLIYGYVSVFPIEEVIVIILFIYFFVKIINNIGRTVWVFLDVISFILILTCLLVPLFFYHQFTDNNLLAVLWVKFMPVPSNVYFGYTLPASLALITGFNIGLINRVEFKYSITELISTGLLSRPARIGLQLILISLLASAFHSVTSGSLGFISFLFIKLIFSGFLYLYFSGRKPNVKWMLFAGILLFLQSLQQGMFGELIFMVLLAIIIFTYGKKFNLFIKVGALTIAIFAVAILQSVKQEYRQTIWSNTDTSTASNIALFTTLASQKTQDAGSFFSEEKVFFTAVRFNQGWLVASVMKNVPSVVPYAEGETIWKSLLASIAPRFLWPDKPQAGGKENIKRFLGWDLRGTSMNIGLLGESYANFGVWGGCVFLFFYGLAFQWAFNFVIRLTHLYPTIILWMPLLFFYCIGVENDVLTVVNHLTKTAFFVYILYKIYPKIFNIRL